MSAADYAIVVGIDAYPALGEKSQLRGACNDAADFIAWLRSEGVPDARIKPVPCRPTSEDPREAPPTAQQIEGYFRRLYEEGRAHLTKTGKFRFGRRLYLFFAGHGFSVEEGDSAFLTANADREWADHVAGMAYAHAFRKLGMFDEVVLFMDCCRGPFADVVLRKPLFRPFIPVGNESKIAWALATRSQDVGAREILVGVEPRGLFSTALMRGLRGSALDPATGNITMRSLHDYVKATMARLASEQQQQQQLPTAQVQVPAFGPDLEIDKFVIATGRVLLVPRVLHLGPGAVGQQLRVRGPDAQLLHDAPVATPDVTLTLPCGRHVALLGEMQFDLVVDPP